MIVCRLRKSPLPLIIVLLAAATIHAELRFVDGTTGQSRYARIRTGSGTFVAVQLTEGTSGELRNYVATDAAINTAAGGTLADSTGNGFAVTFRSGTASTTADDPIVGYGLLAWKSGAEIGPSANVTQWASSATATTNLAIKTTLAKTADITGFNDIAATDVWAAGTRTLTAGTNIVLAKGTGITGFNDLALTTIVNGVWNELLSGHTTTGSAGALVAAAGDPWSVSTSGYTTPGTFGYFVLAAGSVSPFLVDDDHTWSFDSRTQTTSPDILTETVGEPVIYKAMDFSEPLTANGSIGSITAVTVADVASATEPTLTKSEISPNKKKVNITLNGTSATAATYTVIVSITSTDSRTFTRMGKLTLNPRP